MRERCAEPQRWGGSRIEHRKTSSCDMAPMKASGESLGSYGTEMALQRGPTEVLRDLIIGCEPPKKQCVALRKVFSAQAL